MTYEELIAATAAKIGLEGFGPDEDGVCVLESDIGEIVILNCKEPVECVLLNAAVTEVPAEADAALLAALEANKGFKDTKGATLSVDAETNRFELSQYAFLENLEPDAFVAMIERFAASLVGLREKIETAQAQTGEGGGSGALDEAISQFIKV